MRPRVVIPMGDPAGIGPEITLKTFLEPRARAAAEMVVAGGAGILRALAQRLSLPVRICPVENGWEAGAVFAENGGDVVLVPVIDLGGPDRFDYGVVNGECGRAAFRYVERAVEETLAGAFQAVVTTAVNKESLRAGGVPYIGHTEMFAALTGTEDPLTLFQVQNLRIFFLSRHVSLRQACDLVTEERLCDYTRRCIAALRQLGVAEGIFAIAGLNPHSGEHGLFGDEEVRAVFPAVERLQAEGYAVEGPIGADSVFHLAKSGRYTGVLSLYHDQGHIAAKTLDFMGTVSVTAGMPILRTSVDHGTAFDIAGKGLASPESLVAAVEVAAQYAPYYGRKN